MFLLLYENINVGFSFDIYHRRGAELYEAGQYPLERKKEKENGKARLWMRKM